MRIFRIRPLRASTLYANIHLCETQEEFDAATGTSSLRGLVRPQDVIDFSDGRQRTRPKFADVYLVHGSLGTGVVSHEMFHLTMAYLRRRNWKLVIPDECDEYEERVAWIHGNLMRQTTIGLFGPYPNG